MKNLLRNIAAISAVFATSFAIMLIVGFVQMRTQETLSTPALEKLKELNDQNPGNAQLQEQIRALDLMARNAFFATHDHQRSGVVILLVMLGVMVVALKMLNSQYKSLPSKDLDPIDEWAIKTLSRRYLIGIVGSIAVLAIGVGAWNQFEQFKEQQLLVASNESSDGSAQDGSAQDESAQDESSAPIDTTALAQEAISEDIQDTAQDATVAEIVEISKITSNSFRGNGSNGSSSAKSLATDWDLKSSKNILWKSSIPKHGFNTPIINNNHIFFTGADNAARELYCYDLTTGKMLWKTATDASVTIPKTTDDTGLAAPSATTNGKQICAIFATGEIMGVDYDGKRLWSKNLGTPDNHYGYASSLVSWGDLVIVQYDNNTDQRVMALNMATGKEVWNKKRVDKIAWSSPVIAGKQLILMGNPSISAYNPSNGEQLWRVECMSGEVASSPTGANGIVFGASEYATVIAINAATGETIWKSSEFMPEISSPVANSKHLFVATSYGMLVCYDAATGTVLKEQDFGCQFYASPMLVGGRLYIPATDGKFYITTADAELKTINTISTGERTFASPAFTDNKIVIRSEKSLYCVSTPAK